MLPHGTIYPPPLYHLPHSTPRALPPFYRARTKPNTGNYGYWRPSHLQNNSNGLFYNSCFVGFVIDFVTCGPSDVIRDTHIPHPLVLISVLGTRSCSERRDLCSVSSPTSQFYSSALCLSAYTYLVSDSSKQHRVES